MPQVITSSELNVYPSLAGRSDLADLAIEADGILRAHLRRKVLASESLTETFRLRLTSERLDLSEWPVTAISSITVSGVAIASDLYEVEGRSTLLRLGWKWPAETKIVVNYTAGYASGTPQFLTLKRVAAWIAIQRIAGIADPLDPNFGFGQTRKVKLGDYEIESIQFAPHLGDSQKFPDEIERSLKPFYRKLGIS